MIIKIKNRKVYLYHCTALHFADVRCRGSLILKDERSSMSHGPWNLLTWKKILNYNCRQIWPPFEPRLHAYLIPILTEITDIFGHQWNCYHTYLVSRFERVPFKISQLKILLGIHRFIFFTDENVIWTIWTKYGPYHIAAILYGPYIITCVSIWCLLFWMKA